jgi:uncharacterized protein (DUF2252 family)
MSEDFDQALLRQGHKVLEAAGLLVSAIRDNNLSEVEVLNVAKDALGALAKSVGEKGRVATQTPPHPL